MKRKQPQYTGEEVTQALNQAVEEGSLHIIIKDGEVYYIENTFKAGYEQAKRDLANLK